VVHGGVDVDGEALRSVPGHGARAVHVLAAAESAVALNERPVIGVQRQLTSDAST
jgi:hypothetical protein